VIRLGHIPGAMTSFWKDKFSSDGEILDMEDLNKIFIKQHKLSPDKEVIVYCTGGLEASMRMFRLKLMEFRLADLEMRTILELLHFLEILRGRLLSPQSSKN